MRDGEYKRADAARRAAGERKDGNETINNKYHVWECEYRNGKAGYSTPLCKRQGEWINRKEGESDRRRDARSRKRSNGVTNAGTDGE